MSQSFWWLRLLFNSLLCLLIEQEKKQPPVNSDVAAFASRAKVVYPINQKYRVSPPSLEHVAELHVHN